MKTTQIPAVKRRITGMKITTHKIRRALLGAGRATLSWIYSLPRLSWQVLKRHRNGICLLLVLVSLWEASALLGWINTKVLSSPFEVVRSFSAAVSSGSLLKDSVQSIKRVLVGFALGSLSGILIAILVVASRRVAELAAPIIELIRPIPPIAWVPMAILWFGLGDPPAYFLVALGAFFPVFTNLGGALRDIEKKQINVARSLGASTALVCRKIIIPLVLPDLVTGLRVGLGVSWIIVITAEMVGVQEGLGYMIQLNRVLLQTPNVIVGMISIGAIGLALSLLMDVVETVAIPWKRRMAILQNR